MSEHLTWDEFPLPDIALTGTGGEQTRDMFALRVTNKDKNANSF